MNILNILKQLRDDIKAWVTNNLNALNSKIDEKTIPIDNKLDITSTNPVQNKAVATEIADINNRVGDTTVAKQITDAINKQPHFSGDYNDLTNAPNISEDESGDMVVTDESGNIIFKVDEDGIHTTNLSLNGEVVATEKYVNDIIAENKSEASPIINLGNGWMCPQDDQSLSELMGEILGRADKGSIYAGVFDTECEPFVLMIDRACWQARIIGSALNKTFW